MTSGLPNDNISSTICYPTKDSSKHENQLLPSVHYTNLVSQIVENLSWSIKELQRLKGYFINKMNRKCFNKIEGSLYIYIYILCRTFDT